MKNTIKNTMLGISIFLSMSLPLLVLAEGNFGESTRKCLFNATVEDALPLWPNGVTTTDGPTINGKNLVIVVRLKDLVEEVSVGRLVAQVSCETHLDKYLNMKLIQIKYDLFHGDSSVDLLPGNSVTVSYEHQQIAVGYEVITWTIITE